MECVMWGRPLLAAISCYVLARQCYWICGRMWLKCPDTNNMQVRHWVMSNATTRYLCYHGHSCYVILIITKSVMLSSAHLICHQIRQCHITRSVSYVSVCVCFFILLFFPFFSLLYCPIWEFSNEIGVPFVIFDRPVFWEVERKEYKWMNNKALQIYYI